jgi:DUF1365 family protein
VTLSALYAGAVVHQRLRPVRHKLRYGIVQMLLDLDELPALSQRLRMFAHDRFGVFAFHERDHGGGVAGGLRAWVEQSLLAAGIAAPCGAIRLLCMPRILGHAFNPISVFFCHGRDTGLIGMIYEVRNTFGEKHVYIMPANGNGAQIRQSCAKAFYVSPFMAMDLTYRFRVSLPGTHISLGITASDSEGTLIATAFGGAREVLTDMALLRHFLRMPLQGIKVLVAIHWEALKLWFRGVRFVPRTN